MFNEDAISLNLTTTETFAYNPIQTQLDDKGDCSALIEKLTPIKDVNPEVQAIFQKYSEKVQHYIEEEEANQRELEEMNKVMTPEEVKDKLQPLQSFIWNHDEFEIQKKNWRRRFCCCSFRLYQKIR